MCVVQALVQRSLQVNEVGHPHCGGGADGHMTPILSPVTPAVNHLSGQSESVCVCVCRESRGEAELAELKTLRV